MAVPAAASESTIRRHTDLEIPVDGETVAATRYEPTEYDGPLPVLLMYVPYPKDDMITYGAYDPLNRYLARNGYEVVIADMVGTGASTGRLDAMFGTNEGREAEAVVEWLADREWSTGRIGMYGKSYGGITALAAAARQPEALEAIVPIHTPYMGYRNAYSYGGLFELSYIGMDWLTLMQVLDAKPPSRRDQRGEWVDTWQTQLEATLERDPFLFDFLDHDVKDEFWEGTDIPVEKVQTPMLAVGGMRDSYTRDTVEFFEAADGPKQLLLGPWRHTMPHRGRETAIGFRKKTLEWFDSYLKDEPRGIVDEPTVQVWTEQNGGGNVGDGVWRGLSTWPDATEGSDTVSFAFTDDGLRQQERYETGRFEASYESDFTVGLDSIQPASTETPVSDTNQDDVRSLTVESEPLERPLDFTGTGKATVRLRTTIDDPTLSVRVVDVAPDGQATMVTHGTKRVRCKSLTELDDPIGSEEVEVEIPLKPKSHCFEAGHRVRIAVSNAFFPEFLPTGTSGTTTVLSSPENASVVELPGTFREDTAFRNEISLPSPEESLPTQAEGVVTADSNWERSREAIEDTATVRTDSSLRLEMPHVDMTRESEYEMSVAAEDPSSVVAEGELRWTLEYPNEVVTVVVTNQFDRDFAEATTKVLREDTTIFEKTWSRPVNR
jgi:putative CocE/NonD family hydrolase